MFKAMQGREIVEDKKMDRLGKSPGGRSISLNNLAKAYLDLIHKARVAPF